MTIRPRAVPAWPDPYEFFAARDASRSFEEREGQDTLDRSYGFFVGGFDAEVGLCVPWAPDFEQRPELFGIAGKGAVGFSSDAALDQIERGIEPHNHAVIGNQLEIFIAHQRAAAQRDNLRMARLHRADAFGKGRGFQCSKHFFALSVEDFADGRIRSAFDFVVQVEKIPSQLVGQGSSDGGLTAPHKAHKVNARRAFELKNHVVLTSRGRESDNGSMQPGLLPLFPLQVVLLPGAELPLHIFEDRYKEMIAEVIRDRIEFGVILANEKGIVNTGCTALIDKVLREYPDGRMDILARGRRRFEIMMLNDERAFLRGSVEFFDDFSDDAEESPVAPEARQRAIDGYREMSKDTLDLDQPQLSFQLAQPVADLGFRQSILTSRSEADRIRQLADFFPVHNLRQKRIQHVKEVAPRNGHGRGVSGIE